MRPCTCDNITKGKHYAIGECRACWLFHHAKTKNVEWGGDGNVVALPKLSPEAMDDYRRQRQAEIRNRPKCGTHLKRLVSYFGVSEKGCGSCKGIAAEMDNGGPDWCRKNVERIVGHMEEQAWKRGIPFMRAAGRVLIETAIRNAEAESAFKLKELVV